MQQHYKMAADSDVKTSVTPLAAVGKQDTDGGQMRRVGGGGGGGGQQQQVIDSAGRPIHYPTDREAAIFQPYTKWLETNEASKNIGMCCQRICLHVFIRQHLFYNQELT